MFFLIFLSVNPVVNPTLACDGTVTFLHIRKTVHAQGLVKDSLSETWFFVMF